MVLQGQPDRQWHGPAPHGGYEGAVGGPGGFAATARAAASSSRAADGNCSLEELPQRLRDERRLASIICSRVPHARQLDVLGLGDELE